MLGVIVNLGIAALSVREYEPLLSCVALPLGLGLLHVRDMR